MRYLLFFFPSLAEKNSEMKNSFRFDVVVVVVVIVVVVVVVVVVVKAVFAVFDVGNPIFFCAYTEIPIFEDGIHVFRCDFASLYEVMSVRPSVRP